MRSIEPYLINLDSWPWSAVYRVALGLWILPVFDALVGGSGGNWAFPIFFIAFLAALRVGPAVLRHILPFSAEAKKLWAERRQIAKWHDCYQWQKLFWFGLGLLPHAAIGKSFGVGELIVTVVCLAGGSAGVLSWRKVSAMRAAMR
jgi:hypothetical protein